jgi:E3 ubiquitin-protein ligase SIAH1
MDKLSSALDEVHLGDLECPVCMQYMVPPIQLCTNGHNICSNCRERVQSCPTCRAEILETRNLVLENIVRRQKYPCENRQSGCLDLFSIEHIAKHHAVCVYGKIKCPLHLLGKCSWNGLKNDLKEHAKESHPKYFDEGSATRNPYLSSVLGVVSFFGELFTYYKAIRDGRYYVAVQLIGTSSDASKYKCEFILGAANGSKQISKTFLVHGYSEDFETIFNSGKCLNLDKETVKQLVDENQLKLTVTLSRV